MMTPKRNAALEKVTSGQGSGSHRNLHSRGGITTEAAEPTWQPHERHGHLTTKSDLPDNVFAFPEQRKEPLTDAKHVRNSVARFDQVSDVSDVDRLVAFANIEKAAQYYDVDLSETNWRQLGVHPQSNREEDQS